MRLLLVLLLALAMVGAACDDEESAVTPDEGVDEDELDAGLGEDEEAQEEQGVLEARTFQSELQSLNDSGVSGTVTIEAAPDGTVTVSLETSGYTGGNPHAQHIHIGGSHECPDDEADSDEDGLITTPEGQPFYGNIEVSLTTTGDVGAQSALAVERFPVASPEGEVAYERTFELPPGVTVDDLSQGVVVQHGIASLFDDESAYDGDRMSPIAQNLPLEATIPAACGALSEA